MSKQLLLVAALATATLGGCYKATIHVADAPSSPSPQGFGYHFSVIGIIELSAPVDLRARCPQGPAVIRERETFLGGLVNILLGTYIPVLQVMNDSVDCATGGAPPGEAAPMGEGG
jgi:hypothetical protein